MDEATKLSEYRRRLKEKLDKCLTPKDDPKPHEVFARRGITQEIFDEGRLVHLFGLLLQSGSSIAAHSESVDLTSIADKIRGAGNNLPSCNVLATLLYSWCSDESLRKLSSDIQSESRKPIADHDLPLRLEDAREAFGSDGYQFWREQYIFCPVVLKENDESSYVDNRASCPMPFIEEPVEIGRGAYGIVRKVTIEKGHLVNERDKLENSSVGLSR